MNRVRTLVCVWIALAVIALCVAGWARRKVAHENKPLPPCVTEPLVDGVAVFDANGELFADVRETKRFTVLSYSHGDPYDRQRTFHNKNEALKALVKQSQELGCQP